ncbi:putative phospholipid ABC transporter permease protein MlaE [Roseivivax jejudonensis]|uniref:Putative phospholipid ABC transporter permease protein MlaE n=1 Tax=Roseivivax jejudonensis TaxID=1529041 RepID=A0A1X6ZHN2_9RHOB|nr:MlaE family lipid ABC transporter permease subunit [Roseivivax jejudonensis]SLN51360.1 putative phospholipid ABC transporter permease protein MlaE [Roseivivax jejudonensis]
MTETAAQIETVAEDAATRLCLSGRLTLAEVPALDRALSRVGAERPVTIDLSRVERMDTAGAHVVTRLEARLAAEGKGARIAGASPAHAALLETVAAAEPAAAPAPAARRGAAERLAGVGRRVAGAGRFGAELLDMLGLILARLARGIVRPREFRLTALVHHCEAVGVQAVPIVALMAFLIGIVLAFQGATQLRQFGAEVFVVDLIAISILRELGVLLTSIIVAGRTASAFTAAIGSMKMREEIDAMRTLGLDPGTMLFVPRVLALLLMLPILALIANAAGLVGGGIMAWLVLDISPPMFLTRLVEGTDVANYVIGLIKAPVFALIIGVVGCHAGMRVRGNAESLGRQTSAAVVTAIFAVIVADAVFSVLFAEIGI